MVGSRGEVTSQSKPDTHIWIPHTIDCGYPGYPDITDLLCARARVGGCISGSDYGTWIPHTSDRGYLDIWIPPTYYTTWSWGVAELLKSCGVPLSNDTPRTLRISTI